MTTAHRDPAQRRQQIIVAAADLLRTGDGKLTHRRVAEHAGVPLGSTTYYFASLDDLSAAAAEHLAQQVEADLAETAEVIAASDRSPETIARLFADYLADTEIVRTEIAVYFAALARPELAAVGRRWLDGLVEVLTDLTDPDTALIMAVFIDGACMRAALGGPPLPLPLLEDLTRSLMTRTAAGDDPETRDS